jgi:hypothetical protein|tara:strand:- start:3538 stop:3828 length:291 start_codon:yes stop_codon:yes gene_type:complete
MSVNKVLVQTQYFENYGFHEGREAWKPKGGHTFQIDIDADLLMYSDPAEVFGKMLEAHNTDLEKFEYRDYEVQWQTPTVLGTAADYVKANSPEEVK